MRQIRTSRTLVNKPLTLLVHFSIILLLGLSLFGCNNDTEGRFDDPVVPGPGPGIPGPNPDPDDIPGPDPDDGTGGNTTPGETRAGLTNLSGDVTLPGFENAPDNSTASRPVTFRVVDETGTPLDGAAVVNIQRGSEFVAAVIPPGADRGPRLFFSDRLPRLGAAAADVGGDESDERFAQVDLTLGPQLTSSTSVALQDGGLQVTLQIPQDADIEEATLLTSQNGFYTDAQLVDQLLAFEDLVNFRGVFTQEQLAQRASDSLWGQGGYLFFGALIELDAMGGFRQSNWRLNEQMETDPANVNVMKFLEPMLEVADGSLAQTYWTQVLQVTNGAPQPTIDARLDLVLSNNPLTQNLGPSQRWILVEMDLLKNFVGFTGEQRKLLFAIPVAPRSVAVAPSDGDPIFQISQPEVLSYSADYVTGSNIELFPITTQSADLYQRVRMTMVPFVADVDVLDPQGDPVPAALIRDERARAVQGYYFLPDYFVGAPQDVQPPVCTNCILTNQTVLVGPNGNVNNLAPEVVIKDVFPPGGSGRLSNGQLTVGLILFDAEDPEGPQTFDPDGFITQIDIDWGDGTPVEMFMGEAGGPADLTQQFLHTYDTDGTFQVNVTVYDNDPVMQRQGTTSTSFTAIPNAPPVPCAISIPAPIEGVVQLKAGDSVRFEFDCSVDPDGTLDAPIGEGGGTIAIDWGDGKNLAESPFAVFNKASHIYEDARETPYIAVATIKDGDGASADIEFMVQVSPADSPPVAVAMADTEMGPAPLTVQFNSDDSTDDIGIVSYFWDFGDEFTSDEANPEHTYTMPGDYEASLTVTDALDQQGFDSVAIIVEEGGNQAPIVVIDVPSQWFLNVPLTFSSAGTMDPEGDNLTYTWDFGDGFTSNDPNPTYTYTMNPPKGVYLVSLTVTDDGDPPQVGSAQSALEIVEFTDTKPYAIIDPQSPTILATNDTLSLDGSGSYSPVGRSITEYRWEFSLDGDIQMTPMVDKVIADETEFIVSLRVTDDMDEIDIYTIEAFASLECPERCDNFLVNPRATVSPVRGNTNTVFQFSSLGTFDPNMVDNVQILGWDFDDGSGQSMQENPTHQFAEAGSYMVTLLAQEPSLFPTPERVVMDTIVVIVDPGPMDMNAPLLLADADVYSGPAPLSVSFTLPFAVDPEEGDLGGETVIWQSSVGEVLGLEFDAEFDEDGLQTVMVTGSDGSSNVIMHEISVFVGDSDGSTAPIIDIDVTSTGLIFPIGETLDLDLSATFDPDGDFDIDTQCLTTAGDGSGPVSGPMPSIMYTEPGRYSVQVNCIDNGGNRSDRSFDVWVVDEG